MNFDEALFEQITKTAPTLPTRRLMKILEDPDVSPLSQRTLAIGLMESKARSVIGATSSQAINWNAPVAIDGKEALPINWLAILSAILQMLPQILALFGG